jgi:SAM-dependent methyltransferase
MNARTDDERFAHIEDYYSRLRAANGQELSIYQIWERGEAHADSVTPATYSKEYQSHIVLKAERLTTAQSRVFSIGCGNAGIEAVLQQRGRRVDAIDCNREAVALANQKGVAATQGDFMSMCPDSLAPYDLVYADGLIGHLCSAQEGLGPFLQGLARAGLRTGAKLLISNDAPRKPGADLEPHGSVEGFWLVSHLHLADRLVQSGYKVLESYTFPYHRPQSGLRDRSVCVAERRLSRADFAGIPGPADAPPACAGGTLSHAVPHLRRSGHRAGRRVAFARVQWR